VVQGQAAGPPMPLSGLTGTNPGLPSPGPGLAPPFPGFPSAGSSFASAGPGFSPPVPGPAAALNTLFSGMGNMATGLESTGFNLARQIQGMYANALRNAHVVGNYGPGERSFTTHDGSQGHAYK